MRHPLFRTAIVLAALSGAPRRVLQCYLNLTKAWASGSYPMGLDMAGLSIAWKN